MWYFFSLSISIVTSPIIPVDFELLKLIVFASTVQQMDVLRERCGVPFSSVHDKLAHGGAIHTLCSSIMGVSVPPSSESPKFYIELAC